MERIRTFPRMFSLVMFLGIASLALPLTAHAGGLHGDSYAAPLRDRDITSTSSVDGSAHG